MIRLSTQIVYFGFLLFTLAATLLIYGLARQWSLSMMFFVVINIGSAHYIMTYISLRKSWFALPAGALKKRVAIWLAASAAFGALFYLSGHPLAFPLALLAILVISVPHFFRDYAFFYNQFDSSYTQGNRSFFLTLFLSSAYLAFLFLLLFYFPEKIPVLFAAPLSTLFFGLTGALSMLIALGSGLILFRSLAVSPRFAGAFALPYGGIGAAGILGNMNPIDIVYILVLWHYLLWLGFTLIKMVDRGEWQPFAGQTALVHGAVFGSGLALLGLGAWNSFPELVKQSFVWGLYGFPLWTFMHIAFTAFPYYKTGSS